MQPRIGRKREIQLQEGHSELTNITLKMQSKKYLITKKSS